MSLVAASQWLDTPRVEYLLLGAIATACAAAVAWLRHPVPRRWGIGAAAAAALVVALGALEQGTLRAIGDEWPRYEERLLARGGDLLASRMLVVQEELRAAAEQALRAPADPAGAFAYLDLLSAAPEERGVILYRRGDPAAWGGRIRVLPERSGGTDSIGIAASPFYLAVYAMARRDTLAAVAMTLVHAAPPADRLASTVAGAVANETGLRGFAFAPAETPGIRAGRTADSGVVTIGPPAAPLFEATPLAPEQGAAHLALMERVRFRVGASLIVALAVFVLAAWRASRSLAWRAGALAVALGCTAVAPLNQLSNLTRLFDSAVYFTPLGGPLTANAGALLLTTSLVLLGLLALVRRHRGPMRRPAAAAAVLLVAGLGPFLLRDLARGIQIPPTGVDAGLWLIWQIPLFLGAVCVLLAGATAGGMALGAARGLPPITGPLLAGTAALLAPVVWLAPAGWPWWYTFLWVGAVAALTLSRPSRAGVLAASVVAAFGATTLVWANTARGRVGLAQRELARLERPDPLAAGLLTRFARGMAADAPTPTRHGLLQAYVGSDLAAAGFPTALAMWDAEGRDSLVTLQTGAFPMEYAAVQSLARSAAAARRPLIRSIPAWPGVELALAAPTDAGVVTAVVAPRTTLIPADPVARLIGSDRGGSTEPPYTVRLTGAARGERLPERWHRDGPSIHGIVPVQTGAGLARALVGVELRPVGALVQRGGLLVLLDLVIVGALWTLTVVADGRFGRWLRGRRRGWRRSYRARLSLALFAFFVIPAVVFAVWSYQQLLEDGRQSRMLLVRETLRAASLPDTTRSWITMESRRLGTPLLLYNAGVLAQSSEPLYETLAPTGLLLRPDVQLALGHGEEIAVSRAETGAVPLLFGYRALEAGVGGELVLAAPARVGDAALDRRQQDLGVLVLFATAAGALAALALSGLAARQLATPVGALRQAALAIAGGEREPALEGEPPVEFRPVFTAFRRMAAELSASRTELEAAQRRTSAVLRNVASGVIAVGSDGRVTLANPRAEALLGAPLPPGTPLPEVDLTGVAQIAAAFIASDREDEAFELELPELQLRGRVTRLGARAAVITLDDISALARAQRVLAWGEMARQVAHEIKNPLTPIRLGVQHLRRAHRDPRVDFDAVLDQNVSRILEEIDRLDEIARAFSRYGSAPAERVPAERVDVARVVRDLASLQTMGGSGVRFTTEGVDHEVLALAQASELREVLLNLVENARLADAREIRVSIAQDDDAVTIRVVDDGRGIPAEVLPRIFEPHFSTRTSGSGLGLAVSRRMVESWGGGVHVESAIGEGTEVAVTLRRGRGEEE